MTSAQLFGFLFWIVAICVVSGPYLVQKLFPQLRVSDRWMLPGKLIRDYGTISCNENWFGLQKESLALCLKKGKWFLVFRHSALTPLGWGVSHSKVEISNLSILENVINDIKNFKRI